MQPWASPSLALLHPCCCWYLRTWAVASQRCLGPYIFSRHTPPKLKSPGGTNISPGLHGVIHQPLFLALGRATSLTSAQLSACSYRDVPIEDRSLGFSRCPFLLSEYNHHFSWYFSVIYEMQSSVVEALVAFYEERRRGQIFLWSHVKSKKSLLVVS